VSEAEAVEIAAAIAESNERPLDFDALFHLHYERIARVIARIVRDPARAEELAVEVFWRSSHDPLVQTSGWLYRTATRTALDELRRQARRVRYERFFSFLNGVRNPEEFHAAAQEQAQVRSILADLDSQQAQLLLLRSEGLRYSEIAAALELSPASVGTLLARAQHAFRKKYLARYGVSK
jgi:RNA polymerase sigma-70 factor (ECF subfamily)